jgi:hypothetical protein
MDWLLIFVIVAIVGQFAFIKWTQIRVARSAVHVKKARADLLESAADHQSLCQKSHRDTLGIQSKGGGHDTD